MPISILQLDTPDGVVRAVFHSGDETFRRQTFLMTCRNYELIYRFIGYAAGLPPRLPVPSWRRT